MKSICFVHPGKAQLPDISAYKDYFSGRYLMHERTSTDDLDTYDVLWFFMGFYRYKARPGQFVIYEYSSLSLPPFAKLKDRIKRDFETKPDLRVFQSEVQAKLLNFRDDIPTVYREMGVSEAFYCAESAAKSVDVIYVGAMDKTRQLEQALDKLLAIKPELSILLVGHRNDWLSERYKSYTGVQFYGPVPYVEVPALLKKARYGLNYVPDIYPYNLQTATKLLEYLAAGVPVISNTNSWLKNFSDIYNVSYIDLATLTDWPLDFREFSVKDSSLSKEFLWHNVIRRAGFEAYLPQE